MGLRLANKVAMVTGAGRGIGAEIARVFAAEGASVVVADIDGASARSVRDEIRAAGGTALDSETDISVAAQVDAMFARTSEAYGGVDILVNNAVYYVRDVTIVDLEEADWDKTLSVSLKGPFLCTRRALPMMKARGGGSLITMSSVNALFGVSETAYTAAKGGLIALMRLVAAEYGEWNIRSNLICPGTVGTGNCLDYWSNYPSAFAKLKEMYPLGRIGEPRDVANYALFLASDESSWITGAIAVIDGGLLAGRKFEVE